MTEAEWLATTDPKPLLDWMRGKRPIRSFRLFAAACLRKIEALVLKTKFGYRSLVAIEKLADGLPLSDDPARLREGLESADCSWGRIDQRQPYPKEDGVIIAAGFAAYNGLQEEVDYLHRTRGPSYSIRPDLLSVAHHAAWAIADWLRMTGRQWPKKSDADQALTETVPLAHDIFGNPFRPLAADPAWLTWDNELVVALAQGIYAERAFDRLPILGDALEDAGCADDAILSHLRGPGPHVRGCWVLDLLLDKS